MKTFVRRLFCAGLSIFASILGHHALAADTNLLPRLTIELRDGSRIIGTSTEKTFKFHSELLGELKLKISEIRSLESVSTNVEKLITIGGDSMTVSFVDSELTVKTGFGKVELPVATIHKLSVTSGTGDSSQLLPGLVALWRGDGNGSDSVNGFNGVSGDGVSFENGVLGQAFHFDGSSNGYVEVADAPALELTNALTITFWFKKTQLSDSRPYGEYIINKGGDWTHNELDYGVATGPAFVGPGIAFLFAGGNRKAGNVNNTNWHFCAITAVNGQADCAFYIDGVFQPITRREGLSMINLYPSTQPLYLGAQIDSASGWLYFSKTLIDEMALYNRVLSAEEIQNIFQQENNGAVLQPSNPFTPDNFSQSGINRSSRTIW